jgi:WD40 repeat protein
MLPWLLSLRLVRFSREWEKLSKSGNKPWIKIWNLEKQKLHAKWHWEMANSLLTAIRFSPDNKSWAVGSTSGQIKVFQVPQ